LILFSPFFYCIYEATAANDKRITGLEWSVLRNKGLEADYLLPFQRAVSKLYEKLFSLFHSACGGKEDWQRCVRDWSRNPWLKDCNGKPGL